MRLYLHFGSSLGGLSGTVGVQLRHQDAHWHRKNPGDPVSRRKEVRVGAPYIDMLAEKPGKHEVTAAFGFHSFKGIGELGVHEIVVEDQTVRQDFHIRFDPEAVRERLRRK